MPVSRLLHVRLLLPLLLFALLKLVLPGRGRDVASGAVMWIAETWAEIDKRIRRVDEDRWISSRFAGPFKGGPGSLGW